MFDSATPWTVARQAPVYGIFQARILEWVVMTSSRGSSRPKDRTHVSWVSCTCRWILYHRSTWEVQMCSSPIFNQKSSDFMLSPLFQGREILKCINILVFHISLFLAFPLFSKRHALLWGRLGVPYAQMLSRVQLFVIPWTVTRQAPLPTGFSQQENWSGLSFPPPGYLPNPGLHGWSAKEKCCKIGS